MVRIRFKSSRDEEKAFGFLAGRFSFSSWKSGETLVPDAAVIALAHFGISFLVVGVA